MKSAKDEAKVQDVVAPEAESASGSSDGSDAWSGDVEAEYGNPVSTALQPFGLAKEHIDMLDVLSSALRGCLAHRKRRGLSTELDRVTFSKCPEQCFATIRLHWVQR